MEKALSSKQAYTAPTLTVVEFKVEMGFANSSPRSGILTVSSGGNERYGNISQWLNWGSGNSGSNDDGDEGYF